MLRFKPLATLLMLASASTVQAQQQPPEPELVVRTFHLQHLSQGDAAALVGPYIRARGNFSLGGEQLRIISVRETPQTLARIDSILRANDRAPATVILRFQLIAAESTPGRDPAIADVDAALRSLLRFPGYRLLSQANATTGVGEGFTLLMSVGEDRLVLNGEVVSLSNDDGQQGVRIRVGLNRPTAGQTFQGKTLPAEGLMRTGLTVPLGQTVIVGSSSPGGKIQALILSVRPEIVPPRK